MNSEYQSLGEHNALEQQTTAPNVTPAPARSARVRLPFSGRRLIIALVALVVIVAGGIYGYRYWQNSLLYVSTDDAFIDSNLVSVASTGGGTLTIWRVQPGDVVQAGQVLGVVQPAASVGGASYVNITAPINGTVLRVDGKEGQVVGQAQALAYVANLSDLRVTAYIDETEIHKVRPGQQVAVTVDATGGQVYQGTISEVLPAAASSFSLIPSTDRSTGNFTKVTQRIEVHIDLGDTSNVSLYPGENAAVRIRI